MSLNKVNYVDGQTIISAQNMNDIQDEVIRLGEKEAVQSDWLEQNENSLAYVKNKPFGPVGQYEVICIAEEAAVSNDLIEITVNDDQEDNIYYLYNVTPNMWDFFQIGIYQKIAFEDSDGWYLTVYDMEAGWGAVESLSEYNIPDVIGKVYFAGDTTPSLNDGIIIVEESTNPEIESGIYICFNAQKETWVKRVLFNRSYVWLYPGALSTIDMPLGVNWALSILHGITPNTPLKPMIESANKSLNNLSNALDNKVNKVNGKGLSDVNFTKDYEDEVKYIDTIKHDIENLRTICGDLENAIMANNATPARMIEIATNPHGVSLSTQSIIEEMKKVYTGESSDKIFIDEDEGMTFIKISDKVPAPEDVSKGFTMIISMIPSSSSPLPSIFPPMSPFGYIHVGDINMDSEGWQFVNNNLVITDGMMVFFEGAIIVVNDINNPFGIPEGVYTAILPEETPILCSGLQISGFDLSSSTAPVSRAQIEDILLFIEESMITFTINGVSHRAIKGMTWDEWLNSRYNDTELTIITHWQGGQIIGVTSSYVLNPYSHVRPQDVIQAGEYTLGRETAEPT